MNSNAWGVRNVEKSEKKDKINPEKKEPEKKKRKKRKTKRKKQEKDKYIFRIF